jgi:hypothetical protein
MSWDIFGPFVSATTIEDVAAAQLRKWLPTYLAWAAAKTSRPAGSLPMPSLTPPRGTVHEWPEDVPPVITLVSPGTQGRPASDGRGMYRAVWNLGIICWVEGVDEAETDKLAKVYGAAILGLMLQQPLDSPVEAIEWTGVASDLVPREKRRSLGAAQLAFEVYVEDVVSRGAGPQTLPTDNPPVEPPDPGPPADVPLVEDVDIDVNGRDINP